MGRKPSKKAIAKRPPRRWLPPVVVGLVLAASWGFAWWRFHPVKEPAAFPSVIGSGLMQVSGTPPAEAQNCVKCHAVEVADWRDSHHAAANRLFDLKTDLAAFHSTPIFAANGSKTILQNGMGIPTVAVVSGTRDRTVYHPEAVIGVAPLVQYLMSFPGGRLQVLNLAFDPEKKDWFDAQAPEVRLPEDWSHWQNRGMNWNSQCAFCHMTNLRKNYDLQSDTYHTTWDAMGVSCAQCHGPMDKHAASPNDKALLNKITVKQMVDNCGSCHARREVLTDQFHAGEAFSDHYRLMLPDSFGLYYPDGQVKEEDFEFGSFTMSRMGHKGITCLDCHNPHSGKLKAPVENNALCMTCHTPPGQRGAIPIDVATHGHHQSGTPGSLCVDCHMPVTRYMVRHPRRDHGFTIPDPVLTKELGVPNACNRCHDDKSADWAIDATVKWYGDKMERRSRRRARAIARAEKNDNEVAPELLDLAKSEEVAAWRAVLISFLTPWEQHPEIRAFLEESLRDESPLVRSAAVRAMTGDPEAAPLLKPLWTDSTRLVRLDAAWGLRASLDPKAPVYGELTDYLAAISDQPAGALRQAQFALDEHRMDDALKWSGKASEWDATSGDAHQIHAVVLNAAGKRDEAMAELRKASQVDPKNAQHPFMLALLCGEAGLPEEVIVQLKKAVALDPDFGRAWYNLGLALAQKEDLAGSIAALQHAESLLPSTPEVPYALATVFARASRMDEARKAAVRAQSLGYPPAAQLLKEMQ